MTLRLEHARGETDDHTFVWLPDARVLCTGDLFIWCAPNAGNPQKVQRYAADWARALRRMAGLGAELLLPGARPARRRRGAGAGGARGHGGLPRGALPRHARAAQPGCDGLRDRRERAPARGPRGEALPPPGLRRARVHRAKRGAPPRRLVDGRPERAEARAARGAGAGGGGARRRASGRSSPARGPPSRRATCGSRATSSTGRPRPSPIPARPTRCGPRSTGRAPPPRARPCRRASSAPPRGRARRRRRREAARRERRGRMGAPRAPCGAFLNSGV